MNQSDTAESLPASRPLIPVVGIGASAGGLEPICELLAAVPPNSPLAYVVVQHLDPQHIGMLPELLQRVTAMPVQEAADGMVVEAGNVYVIPPNRDLGYARGALRLTRRPHTRAQTLSIDHFLNDLAAECGPLAAGVVLSGMGSDGSAGLRAIQERGGLTLAQQPASARFTAMPQSAIDSGSADIVARAGEMPALIAGRLAHRRPLNELPGAQRRNALSELLQFLLTRTGNDFAGYKLNTVMRRIERRVALHQCATLETYVRLLQDNPGEVQLLFKEMLIGVTSFFRDQKVWEQLKAVALPQLLEAHPDGAAFKAWVPACSTGEEAYSLAMVFSEAVLHVSPKAKYSLQIFATDLDPDAIDRAREGLFTHSIEADVSPERLQRFFTAEERGYRVRKELRNMIIFAQQNIISDPPFTKLDVLSCRNLLIYFSPKLQRRLIPLFHYALKPAGLLLLGSADTPGQFTELFAPLPGVSRIYQRLDAGDQRLVHYFPTKMAAAAPIANEARSVSMNGNLQTQVEQLLLKKHTPAAVLLNRDGDILYIHGRTGTYLEPAAGKANWNIHAMARDGLRYQLDDLLQRALGSEGPQVLRGLVMKNASGQELAVDMSAEALHEGDALEGMVLLTFLSVPRPAGRRARSANPRVTELEQQLAQARLEIQAVRDEMQTSREELRSANEELQSTNEELQSTNEELTTSKEEMQSLNEELYTVNAELQSKVDDLSLVNSDMKNLLNSTDIATIFLDNLLHIRRFTTQAAQVYKLIAGDVQRPLSDISSDLIYPELEQDAEQVLRTLVFSEKQIPTRNGRWFTVRIMPYRTVDNVIDGLVLTFINITDAKQLESKLRALSLTESGDGGAQ
ncbi:chemotaxis protein CheB [Massilia sp. Root351]|uniref:chemotaxis protein CheB n=1 Tax=Massilia sp. Root351 TaxID=1736522 RepID=UPI0007092831|nr:chemotaxis protein CheB [Massilia sp. Root351]KQV79747.1 chemotaxis protein CheB [Massilia sp. Root351]